MTTLRYVAAALVTAGTLFTSCKVENIEIPEVEQYTREFYKQFGIVDPDHDWTTATRVKAQVSGSIANKASIISVYTAMPGAKNASIAARFTGDTSEFEFDFSNTATSAYVEIRDHNNFTTYGGYLPIRNGVLEITDSHNRSRADGTVPYAYLLNENPALGTFDIKGPGQDLIAKMGG